MQVVTRKASLLLAAIILLLCCLSASAQETPDYAAYFAMHQQAAQPDAVIEIDLSSHPFAQPGLQSGAAAPPAVLEQSAGEAPLSLNLKPNRPACTSWKWTIWPCRPGAV